jgi:hypothetical protein
VTGTIQELKQKSPAPGRRRAFGECVFFLYSVLRGFVNITSDTTGQAGQSRGCYKQNRNTKKGGVPEWKNGK